LEQLTGSRFFGGLLCGLLAAFAASALGADDASATSRKRTSRAAEGPQCPASGARAVGFAKALDGSVFVTTDGAEVRLAGVLAPGEGGEPISRSQSDAAREGLAALLRSGPLTLAADGMPDRYGRVPAQVFAGGAWVQAAMLRAGELRAAPDRASAPCAKLLLMAEDEARNNRAGHWRDRAFALRTPEELRNRVGSFQTVEGTVQSATTYKGRAYINFGPDYRTDFTVTVAPADMKLFRAARLDVKTLAGKRVRVRGWVELYNGPEMEIATPAAIEALD